MKNKYMLPTYKTWYEWFNIDPFKEIKSIPVQLGYPNYLFGELLYSGAEYDGFSDAIDPKEFQDLYYGVPCLGKNGLLLDSFVKKLIKEGFIQEGK